MLSSFAIAFKSPDSTWRHMRPVGKFGAVTPYFLHRCIRCYDLSKELNLQYLNMAKTKNLSEHGRPDMYATEMERQGVSGKLAIEGHSRYGRRSCGVGSITTMDRT